MNETQKAKITRFLDDEVMSDAVYQIILRSFLKKKPNAYVNEQAASFMAIGLLEDAWQELQRLRNEEPSVKKALNQVGL